MSSLDSQIYEFFRSCQNRENCIIIFKQKNEINESVNYYNS